MYDNSLVRAAGRVGSVFNIDPVVVLDGSYFKLALRIAAARFVSDEQKKNSKK